MVVWPPRRTCVFIVFDRDNASPAPADPFPARAALWIRAQRDRFRPHSRPLTAAERACLRAHLPPVLLRTVRLAVVPSLAPPDLRSAPRALRLDQLLDVTDLEAFTFIDTIVLSRARMPPPERVLRLLFHEMVHTVQYRHLGAQEFARLYLDGWVRAGHEYQSIPLERQAFALEARFARRPGRAIPVERLVRDTFRSAAAGSPPRPAGAERRSGGAKR